ncbi:helix-turn-helix transcriptional regulator [Hamadaea sp. NPDC051192]|uniref:helix-turn-helix transcriptional regulator n=1 Tax=Hamadaea sp. NPDC051192 TaxID=3154940 RepID=UPI0034120777
MVRLDGYLLAGPREQFGRAVDSYEGWCLLLPRTGSFAYEVVKGAQAVAEGVAQSYDIVVCPPGGSLRRRMLSPTSFFHARFRTELEPPIGRTHVQDFDRLRADLRMLEAAQAHADLVAAHVVADLILMTLGRREADEDDLVRQATAYILDHFARPDLSLTRLAAALGISPAQLSRRFRAARGVTPVAYVRDVRLRKAREMLAETDDTLQTIAERCGYRSAFYLSRVFSDRTGQSPSSYRHDSRV